MKLAPDMLETKSSLVFRYLLKDATLVKMIPIGSYMVPVLEHPRIHDLGVWGFAQLHPEYRIFVDAKVSKDQRRRCVLHEAIEVINDVFDLELGEVKVRVLEQNIFPLLKQI